MKKAIATLLIAAMATSMIACGSTASQSETTQETKTSETAASTEDAESAVTEATANGELPEKPADFPTSSITCYVGFTAGGGVDTAARLLLKYAQEYIDVPLVVQNVTGASGSIAVTQALSNKADGTTLISVASGALLADITGTASYDFKDDLTMVSLQDQVPYSLVYRADDERFESPEQFIEYVKAHPGELTCSTSGVNNANYFAAKAFFEENGMEVELVPFDGSADAKTGFLGGHVDLFCETLLETVQMTSDGSAEYVCTFGDNTYVEGVKTNEELGIEMSVTGTFRGFAMNSEVSQDIIDYLSAVFELCEKDPEFIEECAALGLDACIDYKNSADAEAFMDEQYDSYSEYCEALGIAAN